MADAPSASEEVRLVRLDWRDLRGRLGLIGFLYFGPSIFEPPSEQVVTIARPEPGDAVLDVACGTGIPTRRLAESAGLAGRVVGVDLNPTMIHRRRPVRPSSTDRATGRRSPMPRNRSSPRLASIGITRDELQALFSLGEADDLAALLRDAGFDNIEVPLGVDRGAIR